MVFSFAVSLGREGSDDGNENDTPPTRSYIDALLGGKLTESELANLRAEMARTQAAEVAPPDDDDDEGARTAFHTYSQEERQSSRPSGYMQAVKPDSMGDTPTPPARPDAVDDDEAPTLFRPSTRPSTVSAASTASTASRPPATRPPSQPAPFATGAPSQPAARLSSKPAARPMSQPAPVMMGDTPATITRPPPSSLRAPPSSHPRNPPSSHPRNPPSSRPGMRSASHFTPPKSSRDQPLVDLGDLLADDIPNPPESSPTPSPEEIQLSVPSLRSLDPRAVDESYLEAIGGPNSVPRIAVSPGELRCLPLGAQAGFLVSCIDGVSTVDDIIDISGQSRIDTLRILYDLVQHGAVEIVQR